MLASAYRLTLLALYQTAVALGILLLPVALLTRRVGVHLPIGRAVETLGEAYEEPDERSGER